MKFPPATILVTFNVQGDKMEIVIGLAFIGIVGFVGYKKFKKTSGGKDCCK